LGGQLRGLYFSENYPVHSSDLATNSKLQNKERIITQKDKTIEEKDKALEEKNKTIEGQAKKIAEMEGRTQNKQVE
jgi:uncharacterized protein HemX